MGLKNLSNSMDSVAESEHSQVTLTRFSARPLGRQDASRRQWSKLSPGDLLSASDFSLSGAANKNHEDNNRAHFQVVWRQLSFEVNAGSYDRIITNTLDKMSAIFGNSKSKQRSGFEEDHQFAMADSSLKQQPRATRRMIFENLNGYVKSGEITAIIGPSGAGKTSLLNALCGRTDNYRGAIQLLGGSQSRKMRSSIIPQKDYLIEKLTVRECLYYASKILNSDKSFDHEANINRVVKMLNLSTCFDSSISKISGGEYKRVSIAQELLSQPDILILDEPTSGLDSLNCRNLIRALSSLMKASLQGSVNPFAIVMTIHQPDIEIFNMFDHVYCMARGGKVIYDGHPKDTIQVIKSQAQFEPSNDPQELQSETTVDGEIVQHQSSRYALANPANLLLEIASGEYGLKPIESLARLQSKQFETYSIKLHQSGTHSEATGDFCIGLGPDQTGGEKNNPTGLTAGFPTDNASACSGSEEASKLTIDKRLSTTRRTNKNSFFYLTNLLARRAFLATIRDPMISLVSLGFYLSIPIVMYIVFPQVIGTVRGCPLVVRDIDPLALASTETVGIVANLKEEISVSYECVSMFFMVITAFSMCSIAVAALTFPINMHVLLKETRNGWYDLGSFVTAESFASLPFQVMFPAASVAIVYILLGMPSSYLHWRMWAIALVVVIQSIISQTYGLLFGALCMDSVQTAIFLGVASSLPQLIVSGFAIRVKSMPRWIGSLSYLSPYRYVLHMTNMIRFGFGLCPCDESTDEYLRTQQPQLSGLPQQVRSVVSYYLGNLSPDESLLNTTIDEEPEERIPGIFYGFKLNSSERNSIIKRLVSQSDDVDLFQQTAKQLAGVFSLGQPVESCDSARSQVLDTFDAPLDRELPMMFVHVLCLLLAVRVLMFLVIKFRIRSQI